MVVDGHRVGALDAGQPVPVARRDQQARRRTPRRRAARCRRREPGRRSRAAGRSRRSRWCRRSRRSPSAGGRGRRRPRASGPARRGPSGAARRSARTTTLSSPSPSSRADFCTREVAVGRGQDPQPAERLALEVAAGQHQGLQVRLRAAAGEDAVGGLAEADPAGGPVDEVALDEGAADALVEGVHRAVDRRDEELGEQGRYDDRAVEVRGVRRLVEPHRVVEPDVATARSSASRCRRAGRRGRRQPPAPRPR